MKFFEYPIRNLLLWVLILFLAQGQVRGQALLKVLPLGNSITEGVMCQSGDIDDCHNIAPGLQVAYRLRLKNRMNAAGYNTDFIGNFTYGSSLMTDCQNAGFGGIRSDYLADIMETGTTVPPYGWVTSGPYLDTYQPDIILLHIGTNDVSNGPGYYDDISHVLRILDAVDDYESSHGKNVVVFLARLISRKNYTCNSHTETVIFNNLLTSMAQSRISSGDKLVLVDMECGAGIDYATDMIDELHPNVTGYEKMGDKWFEAVDGYNTAPVVASIPDQVIGQGGSFEQISLDDYVSDAEDPDYDLTWSISPADPEHFYVSIDASRKVTVSPKNPDWSGSEDILFTAMDQGRDVIGLQKTGSTLVTFAVSWIPIITGQNEITIAENTPYQVTLDDLTINDPENAPPDLSIILEPGDHYSVDGDRVIPEENYHGILVVPVRIKDGGLESDPFDLVITVYQVNFPPVIVSAPEETGRTNLAYEYQMVALDPNPEDDLEYSAVQKPDWMEINAGTGLVSGTPSKNDVGSFPVTLVVSDGVYDVEQSYTLQVIYYNNPPEIVTTPRDTAYMSQAYTYGIQATDVEQDPLIYFASSIPAWMTFSETSRVLFGIPGQGDLGEHSVVLGVTDLVASTYQSFTLHVVNSTGMPALEYGHQIKLYPNPVSSTLYLELDEIPDIRSLPGFELYDLTGRSVVHTFLEGKVNEINLAAYGLRDGIYLFRLTNGEGDRILYSGKIILETVHY